MAKQPKAPRMLTHGQIWTALDRLAERSGLSPSGLAKRSGLDPTTFNKSKRITPEGRERSLTIEVDPKSREVVEARMNLGADGLREVRVQLAAVSPELAARFDERLTSAEIPSYEL